MKNRKILMAVITTALLGLVNGSAVAGSVITKYPLTTSNDSDSDCSHVWAQFSNHYKRKYVTNYYISAFTTVFHGSRTSPYSCNKKPFITDKLFIWGKLVRNKSGVYIHPAGGPYSHIIGHSGSSRSNYYTHGISRWANASVGNSKSVKCTYSEHEITIRGKTHYHRIGSGSCNFDYLP